MISVIFFFMLSVVTAIITVVAGAVPVLILTLSGKHTCLFDYVHSVMALLLFAVVIGIGGYLTVSFALASLA